LILIDILVQVFVVEAVLREHIASGKRPVLDAHKLPHHPRIHPADGGRKKKVILLQDWYVMRI
jgi:hypothetical protein